MTPTAKRLQLRLEERRSWFTNEWFFKWHHIGGTEVINIDQFNGRQAHYAGLEFSGSAVDVYWDSISRGLRKEVVDQFEWIEQDVRKYSAQTATLAIDECAGLLASFTNQIRGYANQKFLILSRRNSKSSGSGDLGYWDGSLEEDICRQAIAINNALPDSSEKAVGELPSDNVSIGRRIWNSVKLEPNFIGFGIDLKKLFSRKNRS